VVGGSVRSMLRSNQKLEISYYCDFTYIDGTGQFHYGLHRINYAN